ncbi:ATP-dependent DNA helicase N-terminal domain protein [Geoanaerobacter pelophilus]|uniref:DNA 3'-5' helicase II n=1 Tax=Geoanaerobacter pelophilus TaxID=60036 RepID=A0ABQ0MEI4_9BACT|nr:UvrD-helicase domain-containing protein [Geoanaerobacter pelophilus]GAW65512.1 ATP-dependent DNA helicase N-terminal domain protein [Geoanaerobacter pelophilus]
MTVPVIELADLGLLRSTFPNMDFTDAERRAALVEACSKDVQAAPGSGKTTLLAAKLLLLAQKWPHEDRGICVLSHTNVARDEIAKRLSSHAIGARLLGYPHFVGTIHAFVNQFLALPLLRSDGESVDVIDNDIFAARARSLLLRKYTLNAWVKRNLNQGPSAIDTLRYEGPYLKLGWESGKLPGEGTPTYSQAKEIKDELRRRGVFRHDDMFAFAEKLLQRFPDMINRLSWRFPLVQIDEMQDTSWEQEYLLSRVFNASVVMQRYGDRNQRILVSAKDADKLTFPKVHHLSVTTTKRFPEAIAATVRSVQEHGEPVAAGPGDGAPSPVLMLYETSDATRVIAEFGKRVLQTLPDEVLSQGAVKAICARKQGTATGDAGRHLIDYWPTYAGVGMAAAGEECIFHLLADHPAVGVSQFDLHGRVRDVKRAVLLTLRRVGNTAVADVKDASRLFHKLEDAGVDCTPVRSLCHELVIGRGHTADQTAWSGTLDLLYSRLNPLLPAGMSRNEFGSLPIFNVPQGMPAGALNSNECVVSLGERTVCVRIGTVASVKGETHVATLVLEAHGGLAKCFDLEKAIENISYGTPIGPKTSNTLKGLYRNLYVAMSRPTHLLCLAMNRARATQEQVDALVAKGWTVVDISAV